VDPSHRSSRTGPQQIAFARMKDGVYHESFDIMFCRTKHFSWEGFSAPCGDLITRILFPAMLIASLDGKEAIAYCSCRSWTANYPCPRCLVHKSDLANITQSFELRSTATMRAVYERAQKAPNKTAKEKILASVGIHDVQVGPLSAHIMHVQLTNLVECVLVHA
jgi:hypothetical protein